MNTTELLEELIEYTKHHIQFVNNLEGYSFDPLNNRLNNESWSVLECLQHLVMYGDFYLPEIETKIKSSKTQAVTDFKPGILGNYFAKSMLPKEKLNKMKTFKSMNPIYSDLDKTVIKSLQNQLQKMLILLEEAKKVNLNKIKTSVSISPLIKLKLGDTFRVVIYHNERHMQQSKNTLKTLIQ